VSRILFVHKLPDTVTQKERSIIIQPSPGAPAFSRTVAARPKEEEPEPPSGQAWLAADAFKDVNNFWTPTQA
jgi:hypothetical protein